MSDDDDVTTDAVDSLNASVGIDFTAPEWTQPSPISRKVTAMSECNWPTCGCQNVHGSPWCKASFTAHPSVTSTVVQPSPALAALAMRERAAEVAIQRKGIGADTMPHPYDAGYLAACDDCATVIRALPTTFTNAELLAAAMQLPEVRALVEAATISLAFEDWNLDADPYDGECPPQFIGYMTELRAALAPFRKGGAS